MDGVLGVSQGEDFFAVRAAVAVEFLEGSATPTNKSGGEQRHTLPDCTIEHTIQARLRPPRLAMTTGWNGRSGRKIRSARKKSH